MKWIRLIFPLAPTLTLVCLHPIAWAKSPTAKVTVSGGQLLATLEITDPQVLAASMAWGSDFLDLTRDPSDRAPEGSTGYEVSFYTKLADNDVRKACVFYYYPNGSNEQGFVYLPGKGVVAALNEGTIMRYGRDSKWSYASPSWEALIKPLIFRAEAPRKPNSRSNIARNLQFSATSEIRIDHWAKPQPGWLYVLDPRSESSRPGSRIWLLDPENAKVMGSVYAGYEPDFALSPDGLQLYLASGEREEAEIAVIDTNSGKIRHVPFPQRILYNPWYEGLPPYSSMSVSSDGRALRILGQHVFSPGKIEDRVWTLDTRNGRVLRSSAELENCIALNKLSIIRGDGAIHQSVSPGRERVYLGYGGRAPDGMSNASELRSFDTATWQHLSTFRPSLPFWSAVAGGDGKLIYALAPEQHKILVIDAVAFRETHALSIGNTPALALLAP